MRLKALDSAKRAYNKQQGLTDVTLVNAIHLKHLVKKNNSFLSFIHEHFTGTL